MPWTPKLKKQESILDYFPGVPRPVQRQALLELEENWDNAEVFLVGLAVGAGKSRVAYTVAQWAWSRHRQRSCITTPTRILTEQYAAEFPKLHCLKAQSQYECLLEDRDPDAPPRSCKDVKQMLGRMCDAHECCYLKAMRASHKRPQVLANYYTYMSSKLYRDVTIFDEAHQTLDLVRASLATKLWRHDYEFPSWVRTYATLHRWVTIHPQLEQRPKLKLLAAELEGLKRKYLIVREEQLYRGEERECLSLKPLDISNAKPILWPESRVRKLVFLSATMNWQDLKELGLQKRRSHVIDLPSPIPASRRPVILRPVGNMSYKYQNVTLPKLAACVRSMLDSKRGKGLVHAPYAVASKLKELLGDHPRLLTHDRDNKSAMYQEFRAAEGEPVFLASGLYEGIDLAGDDYQWQLVTKVPYPSLAEPVIAYRAETDSDWYLWESLKVVLQACGRICRGAEDYGETLLLDSSFDTLIERARARGMLPQWWLEAYRKETT